MSTQWWVFFWATSSSATQKQMWGSALTTPCLQPLPINFLKSTYARFPAGTSNLESPFTANSPPPLIPLQAPPLKTHTALFHPERSGQRRVFVRVILKPTSISNGFCLLSWAESPLSPLHKIPRKKLNISTLPGYTPFLVCHDALSTHPPQFWLKPRRSCP